MNLHTSPTAISGAVRSKRFREHIEAVHAYRSMVGIDPAPHWSGMWMWDLIAFQPKPDLRTRPSLKKITSTVAKNFNVSLDNIMSNRRQKEIVGPRQVAMYLARELTTRSLPEIGRYFKKDHTTVLHSWRKIEREASRPDIRDRLNRLTKTILTP